jgi:hypothetical protein
MSPVSPMMTSFMILVVREGLTVVFGDQVLEVSIPDRRHVPSLLRGGARNLDGIDGTPHVRPA